MALAEALLKAAYGNADYELGTLEGDTEDAWDALWARAHEDDHTEGDLQVLAEAFGLARLREELKREERDDLQRQLGPTWKR